MHCELDYHILCCFLPMGLFCDGIGTDTPEALMAWHDHFSWSKLTHNTRVQSTRVWFRGIILQFRYNIYTIKLNLIIPQIKLVLYLYNKISLAEKFAWEERCGRGVGSKLMAQALGDLIRLPLIAAHSWSGQYLHCHQNKCRGNIIYDTVVPHKRWK